MVGRYHAHGRCNASSRREIGYPGCTSRLAERIGEYAPGERSATRPTAFGASERTAADEALVSRESPAQEVVDPVVLMFAKK